MGDPRIKEKFFFCEKNDFTLSIHFNSHHSVKFVFTAGSNFPSLNFFCQNSFSSIDFILILYKNLLFQEEIRVARFPFLSNWLDLKRKLLESEIGQKEVQEVVSNCWTNKTPVIFLVNAHNVSQSNRHAQL